MTVLAQSTLARCVDILVDAAGVRWTINELVRYYNDGQREAIVKRPDATATYTTFSCVAGPKQAIPAEAAKLIDIIRNSGSASKKQPVRMVNRVLLDAMEPDWYTAPNSVDIQHFMYDVRDPRTFYVYPPASPSAKLEMVYSAMPVDIPEPGVDKTLADVTGSSSLPDIFSNCLIDYVLYRAFSKDSEYAGNGQRAIAHYAAFSNFLEFEVKGTVATSPSGGATSAE